MKAIKFLFSKSIQEKTVSLKPGKESFVALLPSGKKAISIGIGEPEKFSRRKFILACREVISLARANKIKKLALQFSDFVPPYLKTSEEEIAELMATAFEMANFVFVKFKTPPQEGWDFVEEVTVAGKISPAAKKAFRKGQLIGKEVNFCRIWANTPGGELTPRIFERVVKGCQGERVSGTLLISCRRNAPRAFYKRACGEGTPA